MTKTKPRYMNVFFMLVQIFLIFAIAFFYYLSQPFKTQSVVFVPQGSLSKIIANFNNKNLQMSKIDEITLRLLGSVQAGWIDVGGKDFKGSLTRGDFLKKLTTAKAALISLTLIPGETTAIFLKQATKDLNLDENKLFNEYERQALYSEGMLLPETYKLPKGISESYLISLLLEHAQNTFKQLSMKIFGTYNEKKWYEIIIAASVVQKEAANNDEMQVVASVIYNRLRKSMKLQMDGTLNYGLYSHTKITPERIRNDESPYNTYKFAGLPKNAVCNVSLAAIQAVIKEKRYIETYNKGSSDYLYFMRDKKTGLHIFTTNINDHNKAVAAQR